MSYRISFLLLTLFMVTFSSGMSGCNEGDEYQPERDLNLRSSPVSFHMSFDNLDYFEEEFIELSSMLSIEERKIEFPEGKFGNAIRMNHIPDPVDATNMTGIDLDLVTAAIFNTRRGDIDMGYTQPMLWGSGRINTRLGAVAFWARGDVPFYGPLFEQTSIALTLSLPDRTQNSEESLFVRVHDPALPVRLWNEFAVKLSGFDGDFEQLLLTIDIQEMVLAGGDRLWVDIGTAGQTEVRVGEASRPAELYVSEIDSWLAIDAYADKQMIPARAQYTHMYEYMPWQFSGRTVLLDDPYAFGGPFDMILPAQAVHRVHPDHFLANFMLKMTGPDFRSGHPVNPESRERITLDNPYGAPEWALYMRDYNHKRHAIADWYRKIQNPDGQIA